MHSVILDPRTVARAGFMLSAAIILAIIMG
jgi:preprotein translocase subunit Sec61beta